MVILSYDCGDTSVEYEWSMNPILIISVVDSLETLETRSANAFWLQEVSQGTFRVSSQSPEPAGRLNAIGEENSQVLTVQ
ncbi:hypothetical protein AXG93_2490s1680 [Marchantia polymorpha subsp. ruderalis]|uniref:Uncharacterized protein n=1 Tax=Marchantia polymorpha subsp. ruderalis TaxID=1480154 RepID=A0A176W5R5_MARPO|nr:hypothetical protein AXG93_2490s1680 [Marchantia polymorpha subsp. ruderalis]